MLKQIIHCLEILLIEFKFLITFYVIVYFRDLKKIREFNYLNLIIRI